MWSAIKQAELPVVAVNNNAVLAGGVNVYNGVWGSSKHPTGTVEVIVTNGVVAAVRTGRQILAKVPAHATALTGTGSTAGTLAQLRAGERINVHYHRVVDKAATAAVGRGPWLVSGSRVTYPCLAGTAQENSRPRTAVGWTKAGDMLIVTAQGRAIVHGSRWGGATVLQMANYLKQLGADYAVSMDGGGSTAMAYRTARGGSVHLVDRANAKDPQRPVANVITLE
jgi:exopolysaccharide biosynthesis protein